jgi:hypothetical protein
VGLVEDENLETIASRGKDCALTKITGVVHTVVRSCVNFYNV